MWSLILCNNYEPFLRLCYVMKSGFYITTSKDQLSGWTGKKLQNTSQSQTWTKKRSWSLFDSLLPIWSTIAFWILVTQQTFSTFFPLLFSHSVMSNSCDSMDYSMPGFPVLHHLPELAQTHVHPVDDAIQSSHPLSSPSLPAFDLSQHEGLFQWVSYLHQAAKVLELQHQSFQWIFRVDFL